MLPDDVLVDLPVIAGSIMLVGVVFYAVTGGAAFIFRAYAHDAWIAQRNWGAVFAMSSGLRPVLFEMCAGAVASGRIRVDDGDVTTDGLAFWLNPYSILTGLLALTTRAYLAAVHLSVETTGDLREDFRRRALGTEVAFDVLGTMSLLVARSEARFIWDGLWSRDAWTVVPAAVVLGIVTLGAVWKRSFRIARVSAVGGVAVVLGGWRGVSGPIARVAPRHVQGREPGDDGSVRSLDRRTRRLSPGNLPRGPLPAVIKTTIRRGASPRSSLSPSGSTLR